jgi:hypothetical protein
MKNIKNLRWNWRELLSLRGLGLLLALVLPGGFVLAAIWGLYVAYRRKNGETSSN